MYLQRLNKFQPAELGEFDSEESLFRVLGKKSGRVQPLLVLADSSGKHFTSEEFAAALGKFADSGSQQVVLAVGPADGWSAAALERADLVIAFGRITLPHELALVVLSEQVYRAFTILAGHPYHSGH